MNQKNTLTLLFVLAALLAGSVTLNIMQASGAEDPNYQKARTNTLSIIKDIRKTGTLVENNSVEGWMTFSYDTGTGRVATAKVWITPNATMTRVRATTGADGVIGGVSILPIEQWDFVVGETIFILFTNSAEHSRLEASTVIAGDLLPLSN